MVQPGLNFRGQGCSDSFDPAFAAVKTPPSRAAEAALKRARLQVQTLCHTGGLQSFFPPQDTVQLFTLILWVTGRQLLLREISLIQYGQKVQDERKLKSDLWRTVFLTGWKICSEWWLNTVSGILHGTQGLLTILCNTDLHACQFLICFTVTISLNDHFACSSDFTFTFTVNSSFLSFFYPI